jgi:isochorismate synthase
VLVGPDGQPDADRDSFKSVESAMLGADLSSDPVEPASSDYFTVGYHETTPRSSWQEMVKLAVDDIRKGELEKVVLARELRATASRPIDVVSILRHLRDAHRDSFIFACWSGDSAFVGASPERLVRLEGRNVLASSLAGTIRRGATPDEDLANARALLTSAKDRAEHASVRRALASVLAEFCEHVDAPAEPALLTLPHVHHLHTLFSAQLKDGASLLSLAGRLHPTPAVGGSPRASALAFIDKHEQLDRGWYASPIGWIGRQGGEFAVALRSALVSGHQATLFAGCGIVAGSDPALEYAESSLKMKSMQAAIEAVIAAPGDAVAPSGERQHITV